MHQAASHLHTTIKVTSALRDRLKEQASDERRTLGEHLAVLADLEDRRRRFESLRLAIEASPPDVLAAQAEETAAWEKLDLP